MSLFPRVFASEATPVFRFMDDLACHAAQRTHTFGHASGKSFRTLQPRFDIKENTDAYELNGELPGIANKDIKIEFTDAQTLSIKARTGSVREEVTQPTETGVQVNDAQTETDNVGEDFEKIDSSATSETNYHQPSVEDGEATATAAADFGSAAPTPASTVASPSITQERRSQAAASKPESPRYWLSERFVGEFSRSFIFANRVDHDNVKASLKNGILSIVVPKAAVPSRKRIEVE